MRRMSRGRDFTSCTLKQDGGTLYKISTTTTCIITVKFLMNYDFGRKILLRLFRHTVNNELGRRYLALRVTALFRPRSVTVFQQLICDYIQPFLNPFYERLSETVQYCAKDLQSREVGTLPEPSVDFDYHLCGVHLHTVTYFFNLNKGPRAAHQRLSEPDNDHHFLPLVESSTTTMRFGTLDLPPVCSWTY